MMNENPPSPDDAPAGSQAAELVQKGAVQSAHLVSLIRKMVSDEIANEAEVLLSERAEAWTPLSLIAEAERRYLDKHFGNLDSFAHQQMNSRIVVDVDEEW